MKTTFTIFLIVSTYLLYGQANNIQIKFNPKFENEVLELYKKYKFQGEEIEIHTLKFYVSNIKLYQGEKLIDVLQKKYHLINLEKAETLTIFPKNKFFDRMEFDVGIDSTTNVSGAFGGDLDPDNAMYWAWQSGYINFKLEGKSKICPSRNNQFIYHIGGYQYPFNAIQHISLEVINSSTIDIEMDIATMLKKVNLSQIYQVMSPNQKSMEMAKSITAIFTSRH